MKAYSTFIDVLLANEIAFFENEKLSKHSSFKIGGIADIFCEPNTIEKLIIIREACAQYSLRSFILCKGSNILFSDKGFAGVVIHVGKKLSLITINDTEIEAQCGASLADVCVKAKNASLTGMEFAFGIPGGVGGAIFMNAGAYNGEIKDIIKNVTYLDNNNEIITCSLQQAELGYRMSRFQNNNECIISAVFSLKKGNKDIISSKMAELLKKRENKQPLEMPSAGSAFKRPQGAFAGELIDRCNLRGKQIGGAEISKKHCGFIVNNGTATSADVLALAEEVCVTVFEQTGYRLEKEIRVVE